MKIRKAKIDDAVAMGRLVRTAVRKLNSPYYTKEQISAWVGVVSSSKYKKRIATGDRYIVVVEDKGEVVGVGILNQEKKMISGMYASYKMIGRGIGGKLMRHLEKKAFEFGILKISLNSSLSAVDFYKHFGYRRIKRTFTIMNDVKVPCVNMVKNFSHKKIL